MFSDELKALQRMGLRQALLQALNFCNIIASGLMMWKGLGLVTNTESPIVVVLTGSMEPAFYRGDLLFLTNPVNEPYLVGDITVYKIPGQEVPIVHRVIESHFMADTPLNQEILTKGDNNPQDDIVFYKNLKWLERQHVVGKVRGFLPYIGYVTIAMNDFPQLKYALLGIMGLFALISRE
ncbi:Signal peptidase complex catalytic subunit [Serendipita sp. 407]|nr:Signal peptidase complex catalytic subunit [Serendipita sp. 407]